MIFFCIFFVFFLLVVFEIDDYFIIYAFLFLCSEIIMNLIITYFIKMFWAND